MTSKNKPILIRLRDGGQTIADPAKDLRGRHVEDKDDLDIGTVHDLFVDDVEHKVRMLRLEHGGILGFGAAAAFGRGAASGAPALVLLAVTTDQENRPQGRDLRHCQLPSRPSLMKAGTTTYRMQELS